MKSCKSWFVLVKVAGIAVAGCDVFVNDDDGTMIVTMMMVMMITMIMVMVMIVIMMLVVFVRY